jgi:glycosyltransferase involved in cell wall biosynthesis
MSNSASISVLIPVFNRQAMLEEAVNSVLSQDLDGIEVVISDNASTDKTWSICVGLAEDSRVRTRRNSLNIGPARNWLECAKAATAPHVMLLFSDDLLLPGSIERAFNAARRNEVSFVLSGVLSGPSVESAIQFSIRLPQIWSAQDFLHEAVFGGVPVSPCGCLVSRELFLSTLEEILELPVCAGWERHGAGIDLLLLLKLALKSGRGAYEAEPGVFFRDHSGSISIEDKSGVLRAAYRTALLAFANEVGDTGASARLYLLELFAALKGRQVLSAEERAKRSKLRRPPLSTLVNEIPGVLWRKVRRN